MAGSKKYGRTKAAPVQYFLPKKALIGGNAANQHYFSTLSPFLSLDEGNCCIFAGLPVPQLRSSQIPVLLQLWRDLAEQKVN
ncbi:hypothetical protein [Paenibacillus thiaminolyticus]|uniref:hypothetical protein n=1 Tax=Paenibacillus thiaminolyticus TaxID=49283 RepID=UPI002543D8FF|nr:hypothetical protein [Paenibacillus thiaminolyticus]WII38208.1 hypothetical protein O0V01_03425 [Paenibacillus thiaminolyticus]